MENERYATQHQTGDVMFVRLYVNRSGGSMVERSEFNAEPCYIKQEMS